MIWLGRLGVALKPYGPLDGRRNDALGCTAYRFWPFIFVWPDH